MAGQLFEEPPPPLREVAFTVYGLAQPKGSTKSFAFKRPDGSLGTRTTSDNAKLQDWAALVRQVAQRHAGGGVFFARETAVYVVLAFVLPRPPSIPRRQRHPVRKPDLDKLVRGVLDALSAVIFHDDAQVIELRVTKRYAGPDEPASASVTVQASRSELT
jgi:crossover junction endodeoxyribonuclease RusA